MRKKINHAIIGCGRIAQNHYQAAIENKINVVACCDLDLELAQEFSQKNNIPFYTNDYHDLLNNNEIDSISICTDHKSHVEIAKEFINKKNIIIEKPLSSNLKLAKNFYNESKSNDKIITVISQHRFDLVVNLVKKMILDKVLGNITLVNAQLVCQRSREYYSQSYWRGKKSLEGGSTIINQSFHIVDILNYLFGLPTNVKSYKKNLRFCDIIDTEDTCVSIANYETFLCTLSSTNTSTKEWETTIEIIGTKGNVKFNIDFPEEILELNIDEFYFKKYENELKIINDNYKKNINSSVNYYGLSHVIQFKNFKESILGKSKIKVGVKESLETQKFIEMIYDN